MGNIITEWKCENCNSVFNNRISSGCPDEDIDVKWECGKCGHKNILSIKACQE